MIDAHVHLRDWEQKDAETLAHGLSIAARAGLDAVFEMPNTSPLILDRQMTERRIKDADACGIDIFHGIYVGVTSDGEQIAEAVKAWQKFFPRVVGLKLFAGRSTGNLSVIDVNEQKKVFQTLAKLNYRGLIAIHSEKESFFHPELWNPKIPASHNNARPPEAETESVKDMFAFAATADFRGSVHIPHISVPATVKYLAENRKNMPFCISCGATPHHLFLNTEMMQNPTDVELKVNPPIRSKESANELLELLKNGQIDWIETDHAPHTLRNKRENYASGIPGLPLWPHIPTLLKKEGLSNSTIEDLTHNNIEKCFNFAIPRINSTKNTNLFNEYPINAYGHLVKSL